MQAVVLTSPRAAEWFAARFPWHRGPISVSGRATAARLREAGLECLVANPPGGAEALRLLASVISPEREAFFPCGPQTAGSVEAEAARLGIALQQVPVYDLEPLPLPFLGRLDAVAFLSGQIVRRVRQGIPENRWQELRELPALATPTALAVLEAEGWLGKRCQLEKSTDGNAGFDIPLSLIGAVGGSSVRLAEE